MTTDSENKVPSNGKTHVNKEQLEDAIKNHEKSCNDRLDDRLKGIDDKLLQIVETLTYTNVILTERLSNHAARLQTAESAIADLRARGEIY
jgi:hypothetical protein